MIRSDRALSGIHKSLRWMLGNFRITLQFDPNWRWCDALSNALVVVIHRPPSVRAHLHHVPLVLMHFIRLIMRSRRVIWPVFCDLEELTSLCVLSLLTRLLQVTDTIHGVYACKCTRYTEIIEVWGEIKSIIARRFVVPLFPRCLPGAVRDIRKRKMGNRPTVLNLACVCACAEFGLCSRSVSAVWSVRLAPITTSSGSAQGLHSYLRKISN